MTSLMIQKSSKHRFYMEKLTFFGGAIGLHISQNGWPNSLPSTVAQLSGDRKWGGYTSHLFYLHSRDIGDEARHK